MQTTLLGFAIAIILALVAALVGPFFVDWGRFRGEFEARASRLTGLEFHVSGSIDARLLPTPTLMLHDIAFGRQGEASKLSARSLRVEFALGSLVRGEWKIADARLEAPELVAGLDDSGRIALSVPSVDFDPEGVSIQRLTIENGRATFSDAASASRLVLDQIEFKGELRSLAGPVKGEGSFVIGGQQYPFRVAASRAGDDGGVKVRLAIDPIDRPLTAEVDVSVWIDQGAPRFEGTLALARSVGRAPEGGQALIIEPWRATSRIKGDSAAAVLEQIEFQYGPDDRAIKLRGDARMTFGHRPQLDGVFSSPQIDLDRVLDLPEAMRRRPLVAIKSFADSFAGAHRLPFPVRLGINVETLNLAGAALQRVSADVKTDAETWDIESLELRAPGITQVRLSGRLGVTSNGVAFNGPAKIESSDPRAFVAWLADRTDTQFTAAGSLRVSGDVTLGSETMAIDWLKIELDRMSMTGRFAYSWASDDRPARLDAALTAPEIDIDRVLLLAKTVLGGTRFDWPREGALSLKIDRAAFGGVDVKGTNVSVRLDANGFGIEHVTIADFGGAALTVKGRIDNHSQSPRGEVTLDLDARSLDGVMTLIEKLAPTTADRFRRAAERFAPVKLRALLSVGPDTPSVAGVTSALAKFKIDGRAGVFRIALQGDAGAAADAFALANLANLGAAKMKFSGRLDADDGAVLVELVGLDRALVVDKRPGRLDLTAKGALDGDLAVQGQLAAGLLTIAGNGTIRVVGPQSPVAGLELKIANANVRSLRAPTAGRPAELLPMSATARLALADGIVTLTDLVGTIAGTSIGGRLTIGTRKPVSVAGDIELDALDLPSVLSVALGAPAQGARAAALWSAEPFEAGLPDGLRGQISLKSARVSLTPQLTARSVRGTVQFGGSELVLQDLDGSIAGGQIGGELSFARRADGLSARGRARLSGVNAADFLPGEGPLVGRLTLDVNVSGSGKSPLALIGSLGGSGSFMLENGQIARLDPRAFEAVIRAVDQGLPIDAVRVRDRMEVALAGGNLPVALAEGAITITAGQARLSNTIVRAQGADLAINGSVNLADAVIDGRLMLSGVPGADGANAGRPEIAVVLKGPFDAAKRTIDAAAFASWLALRAVEQQARKLDALEGHAAAPSAPAGPAPPAKGASPPVAPALPAAQTGPPAESEAAAPDVATPTPRPRPTTLRVRPKASTQKPRTATAPGAVPLDLRPGSAPRAQNGAGRTLDLPRLFQWPQP